MRKPIPKSKIEAHEATHEFSYRLDDLNAQEDAVARAVERIDTERDSIAADACEAADVYAERAVLGPHYCPIKTNPSATCIYDDETDPTHDDCLFCHEPRERK